MSRRPSLTMHAFGDQVAAVLRDAETPMTATDIAATTPVAAWRDCDDDQYYACMEDWGSALPSHVRGVTHMDEGYDYQAYLNAVGSTTQALQRLEKMGMGRKVREPDSRRVWWEWTGPPSDPAAYQLEALLAL